MYIYSGGRGEEESFFSINVIEQLNMLMGENKLRTLTYIINKHSVWTVRNIAESSNVQKVLKRMSAQRPGREEPGCELKVVPKSQVKSLLTKKAGGSGMNRSLTTATHLSQHNMHQVLPNTSSQLERLNFTVPVHSTCDPQTNPVTFITWLVARFQLLHLLRFFKKY